jgi:hypothetical protein
MLEDGKVPKDPVAELARQSKLFASMYNKLTASSR